MRFNNLFIIIVYNFYYFDNHLNGLFPTGDAFPINNWLI